LIELAQALALGELTVIGRLPDASNVALLCEVPLAGRPIRCIYKPAAGERPLWDFPGAVLAGREVLTAEAAACFGWDVVPVTVWRDEAPAGPGMVQEWIGEPGPPPVGLFASGQVPQGWVDVAEGRTPDGQTVVLAHESSRDLARVVLLDALVNNGDRKGGHLLRRPDGRLAAIDHGVSFHAEPKLRTVLWGWAGEAIDAALLDEVVAGRVAFAAALPTGPAALHPDEVAAALGRLEAILDSGAFPVPSGQWPALPWPPM
jgi:uncharacterized repeat protein (TIGR03843 family)